MMELKDAKTVLERYGITVNNYLTYAQIQAIANAAMAFDTWSERKQNITMLLLHFATDMSDEDIESIGIERIVSSGLADAVELEIFNYYNIGEAIMFHESMERNVAKVLANLDKQGKKNGAKSKK